MPRLTYHHVGSSHMMVRGKYDSNTAYESPPKDPRLPKVAQIWWRSIGIQALPESGHAVVVYCRGRICAFFRYELSEDEERLLSAAGTWVAAPFRKHGIARRMWELALNRSKPRSVTVCVASSNGYRLLQSIKRQYQEMAWEIEATGPARDFELRMRRRMVKFEITQTIILTSMGTL